MPHIHEKIDMTVEVFIVHKNTVLLRMHDKYKIWLSIGGHIELDEDPVEAAFREVEEEVGLQITLIPHLELPQYSNPERKELLPPRYMNRHAINASHEHISLVYFATSDSDQVVPEKKEDLWKWVSADELSSMDLNPDVEFYARKALEELGTN
ncbi:MAG: NUDIX domain-containing protein [Patescibacteria group bacterium]